jgi:hypothetical protein
MDELIKSKKIFMKKVQKSELKIGMFPENVSLEFLQDSYFKKFPFFDKIRKVSSINLIKDRDSLLN